MCTSTYAPNDCFGNLACSIDSFVPGKPAFLNACKNVAPCLSTLSYTSSGKVPTIAREPRKVDPNRTPSSSEKPMIWMLYSLTGFDRLNAFAAAIATTTPKEPSKIPPSMTVSKCDPTNISLRIIFSPCSSNDAGVVASNTPWMLPAASVKTLKPASAIHSLIFECASIDALDKNCLSKCPAASENVPKTFKRLTGWSSKTWSKYSSNCFLSGVGSCFFC